MLQNGSPSKRLRNGLILAPRPYLGFGIEADFVAFRGSSPADVLWGKGRPTAMYKPRLARVRIFASTDRTLLLIWRAK